MIATTCCADDELIRFRGRSVTLVGGFPKTASVRRHSGGRERHRNKSSDQREQKQKSGG